MKRYAEMEGRGCCPLCAALSGQVTHTESARQPEHPWYREIDDGSTEPLAGVLCRECAVATISGESPRTPSPADVSAWRESERMTQSDAAGIAGVALRAWQRWESGERSVPQWLADTLRQRWGTGP